jgi:tripartite-type tricarboxylate transporter receptor subunit TctC
MSGTNHCRHPCRRRAWLAAGLLAAAGTLGPTPAHAQGAWPTAPIRLVVPFAPGGNNDNIARPLAEKLSARLGQTVVVDNRGGGGGTIGTDLVAKAPADGHTLLFASTSIITNAASGKKLPYDPVKDLAAVGMIGSGTFAIVVNNGFKATTLREFIDVARAKPKSVSYGSAGIGGLNHLGTELFASVAKIEMVHIPYKGIGPAFNDLLAGNLHMALPTLASVAPHVRAAKMRALAVTGSQRSPLLPEVPTATEAGLPGFDLEVWWGLLAPARTPPAVVKRLNEELNAVLSLPEMRELLEREGALPRPGSSEQFGAHVRAELTRWEKLIKDAKIQVD